MINPRQMVERLIDRGLDVCVSGTSIVVPAGTVNGFSVSLFEHAGKWVVNFEKWHEEFDTEREAIACFAFGLSADCRLKIEFRGPMVCRWTVESKTDIGWKSDSTVGLLLYPFWRRARIEYRQNGILPGNGSEFLK